ncbi:MAG: hypothetical protein ABJK37_13865 [Paraglaciecola sp.]|uniref:hypothetical protein n=1 Tax=Paraglaciecola sp. TaxID=1920173 RepID=UPI0032992D39
MKLIQKIMTTFWLLVISTACDANKSALIKKSNNSGNREGQTLTEKEQILSSFKTFYFDSVLPQSDKKQDREFVADLIQSPQIPPSVEHINCQSAAIQLLKLHHPSSIEALTLYGSLEELQHSKECWFIHYQSMLSGGVSAFKAQSSDQYLLVLLNSEG